ncbi:MAG: aminodeoxychorismate/anthranilate synthase component II [Deltaproteobacteria bacterium]|nr:aminodeoxychorismate/anthranilate synthase component II [Deltaproteobacteria bacterium]
MVTLLVIDNYDSFTYNLVQMFMLYDLRIKVIRCDQISLKQVESLSPDYVLISPGPKDPQHAGISIQLVRTFFKKIPILGICLGMQCINEAFGGKTIRAPVPMHGKTSIISHIQQGIFKNIPSPFTAARYHSLVAQLNGNKGLMITSQTQDGIIMGLSHPSYPLHGLQFHPESFLTEYGFELVENFFALGPYKKA